MGTKVQQNKLGEDHNTLPDSRVIGSTYVDQNVDQSGFSVKGEGEIPYMKSNENHRVTLGELSTLATELLEGVFLCCWRISCQINSRRSVCVGCRCLNVVDRVFWCLEKGSLLPIEIL